MITASAKTTLTLDAPQEMLSQILSHLRDDHGMGFRSDGEGAHVFEQDGYRVEFALRRRALDVTLGAPGENAMQFSKEGMVQHIAALSPEVAQTIRWEGVAQEVGTLPRNFRLLTVLNSRLLFEGMQRVTLQYPDIARLQTEGLHVRMILPCDPTRAAIWPVMGANGAPVWPTGDDALHARYLTLKNIRPETEEVEVDVVRHRSGLISRWAQHARSGQQIGTMGPVGITALPEVASYFLAADGTGLPAVAQLMSRLSHDAVGDVVVALPAGVSHHDYLPQTKLRIHTVAPDRFEATILEYAQALTTTDIGYAFFAGEFANAQQLRQYFRNDLSLDKTKQVCTAYWRRTS